MAPRTVGIVTRVLCSGAQGCGMSLCSWAKLTVLEDTAENHTGLQDRPPEPSDATGRKEMARLRERGREGGREGSRGRQS